jgi:hypothetical protein
MDVKHNDNTHLPFELFQKSTHKALYDAAADNVQVLSFRQSVLPDSVSHTLSKTMLDMDNDKGNDNVNLRRVLLTIDGECAAVFSDSSCVVLSAQGQLCHVIESDGKLSRFIVNLVPHSRSIRHRVSAAVELRNRLHTRVYVYPTLVPQIPAHKLICVSHKLTHSVSWCAQLHPRYIEEGINVIPSHSSNHTDTITNSTLATPSATTVTVYDITMRVSLQLAANRYTVKVRFPVLVGKTKHLGLSATGTQSKKYTYLMQQQCFPVAAVPKEWRHALDLAQQYAALSDSDRESFRRERVQLLQTLHKLVDEPDQQVEIVDPLETVSTRLHKPIRPMKRESCEKDQQVDRLHPASIGNEHSEMCGLLREVHQLQASASSMWLPRTARVAIEWTPNALFWLSDANEHGYHCSALIHADNSFLQSQGVSGSVLRHYGTLPLLGSAAEKQDHEIWYDASCPPSTFNVSDCLAVASYPIGSIVRKAHALLVQARQHYAPGGTCPPGKQSRGAHTSAPLPTPHELVFDIVTTTGMLKGFRDGTVRAIFFDRTYMHLCPDSNTVEVLTPSGGRHRLAASATDAVWLDAKLRNHLHHVTSLARRLRLSVRQVLEEDDIESTERQNVLHARAATRRIAHEIGIEAGTCSTDQSNVCHAPPIALCRVDTELPPRDTPPYAHEIGRSTIASRSFVHVAQISTATLLQNISETLAC